MLERLRNLVLEALPEEGRIENPMPCLALTRFNGPQQSRQCFYHPFFAGAPRTAASFSTIQ